MNANAMIRRHALWAGVNIFLWSALYVVLNHIRLLFGGRFFQYGGNNLIDFVQFLAQQCVLTVYAYYAYNEDTRRFGGTGIRMCTWRGCFVKSMTSVVLGTIVGKCLLDQIDMMPGSYASIARIFTAQAFMSVISAFVAINWMIVVPSELWAVQEHPLSMAGAMGNIIAAALQKALPRSVIISLSLTCLSVTLKAVESLLFTWYCRSARAGMSVGGMEKEVNFVESPDPFCEALSSGQATLPMYLPDSSVWSDLLICFMVSLLITLQVEVLTHSLSFITSYPLDFSKLQAQLVGINKATIVATDPGEGGSVSNELLLVRALVTGLDQSVANSKKFGDISPANYTEKTAIIDSEEQDMRRRKLEVSLTRAHQYEPFMLSYFGEVRVSHKSEIKRGLKPTTIDTAASFPPVNNFDLLTRSLAFHDLHRIAQAQRHHGRSVTGHQSNIPIENPGSIDENDDLLVRRKVIYSKHWKIVMEACCGMIDATTLQIEQLNRFMTTAPDAKSKTDTHSSIITAKDPANIGEKINQGGLAGAKKTASTSFENIVKLRAQLSGNQLHQRQQNPQNMPVPIEKDFDHPQNINKNGNGSHNRPVISKTDRYSSSVNCVNSNPRVAENKALAKNLGDYIFLSACSILQIPVPGRGVQHAGSLPIRALPPMCAATIVYAVRSASLLLKHALREDSTAQASRSMCTVLRSLLMLEDTVGRYCATLQAAQCVRIATMGRTQEIRYRARSENAVPECLRRIITSTKEAIILVIASYRDVLLMIISNYNSAASSVMFTKQQMLTIEAKLIELDSAAE